MDTHRKILLIDDDEAVLAVLDAKLSRRYEVLSTSQPQLALAIARRERPDAILCDIDMPELSGGEVAAALASDPGTADIPLIYLTALLTPEEADELQGSISGRPAVAKRAPLGQLVAMIEGNCAAATP
jgi:CheY-like chemotaxis protein